MLKRLLVTTAIGGLIATGALAQTSPPASPPAKSPPAATEPAPKAQAPSPGAKADAKNMVISEQKPDQWLASKFRGTNVVGPKDEKIGDVADVLFDKSGKVEAIIIGVGGFLGMGQKQVGLSLASFDVVPGDNGASPKLKLNMSKEQLQQAAEFKPYSPPRPAAQPTSPRPGAPGGPGTRPSPGTGN
jgi:hypothetical protein